jgi:hypothetical protein
LTWISIYAELAEQYRLIDAASNAPKRNILAQHLKEIIDILEKKVSALGLFSDPFLTQI